MGGIIGFGAGGPVGGLIGAMGPKIAFARLSALALTNPATSAAAIKLLRLAAVSTIRGVPLVGNELVETTPAVPRVMDWSGGPPDWSPPE
jgi:hypothetical protein